MTSCSLMNVAFARRSKSIIGMLAHAALIENPIFLSLAGAQDQATHRDESCFRPGKIPAADSPHRRETNANDFDSPACATDQLAKREYAGVIPRERLLRRFQQRQHATKPRFVQVGCDWLRAAFC